MTFQLANPNITSDRYNEVGALGRAGVFTDEITIGSGHKFYPGVQILLDDVDLDMTVVGNTSLLRIVVDGITEPLDLPLGNRIDGRISTSIFSLRDSENAPTVENLVPGDMLRVSGLERKTRILAARQLADTVLTLSQVGTTITATSASAHMLNTGNKFIYLIGSTAGVISSGQYTVSQINSPTEFEFESEDTVASGGRLQGYTVEIDEALSVEDGPDATVFTVDGRWLPIEAPTTAFDLPPTTTFRYFDSLEYTVQDPLKSTIINDSMFLVNDNDEVFKFDGESLYRAGLPRWQPGLFMASDTTGSLASGLEVPYTAKDDDGKWFETATSTLKAGDRIQDDGTGLVFLVTEVVFNDTTASYQVVVSSEDDISSTASTGTLKKILVFKYYVRLNMIDTNQAIVASYTAQSEDLVFDYGQTGQIRLRLAGLPVFGPYDFDRIEMETYRTEANGQTFNLQSRRLVDFDQLDGYLDIIDSLSDASLSGHPDVVTTALVGAELGTGWDQPPRANCITSINNRLILGNIKSYPELDVTLKPAVSEPEIIADDLDGLSSRTRRPAYCSRRELRERVSVSTIRVQELATR